MLIATTNTQGSKWNVVRALIRKHGASAVCVQECGQFSDVGGAVHRKRVTPDDAINWYDWDSDKLVLHAAWGTTKRCSMAIVLASQPRETPQFAGLGGETVERRPLIALKWREFWIACIHATATGGPVSAQHVANMVEDFRKTHETWVCVGDNNVEPDVLGVHAGRWRIAPPSGPTHTSGKMLDYATHSPDRTVTCTGVLEENGGSDHFAAIFDVS